MKGKKRDQKAMKSKKALEERFNPRIKVEIINGGLFYLK